MRDAVEDDDNIYMEGTCTGKLTSEVVVGSHQRCEVGRVSFVELADGPVLDDCSQEKGKKGDCFEAHQLDDSAALGSLSGPERRHVRVQSKKATGEVRDAT